MNKKEIIALIFILLIALVITPGFSNTKKNPQSVYRVYLKGESLGLIKSKKSLEDYIDNKQAEIKKKFKVDKVYAPAELTIKKEITYSDDIKTNKEIYEEIKDISPFTISGYMVKIKKQDTKNAEGKKVKGKTQELYVIKKDVFEKSIEKAVKSFIPEESYDKYAEDKQAEIKDTGKIIENIYLKNKITITKQKIPVDEKIYLNIFFLEQLKIKQLT